MEQKVLNGVGMGSHKGVMENHYQGLPKMPPIHANTYIK